MTVEELQSYPKHRRVVVYDDGMMLTDIFRVDTETWNRMGDQEFVVFIELIGN